MLVLDSRRLLPEDGEEYNVIEHESKSSCSKSAAGFSADCDVESWSKQLMNWKPEYMLR